MDVGEAQLHTLSSAALVAPKGEMAPHWYAVMTHSRHEKAVAAYFAKRQIQAFLPLYKTVRCRTNRCRVTLELPLFPNYLFVKIRHQERVRVLGIPGVIAFLGGAGGPAPLPDGEIEALRSGLHLRRFEPHPYLTIGDRVRVRSGPMMGLQGVLVRKKNDWRVVVTVEMIRQSVAVEVDATEIEPST